MEASTAATETTPWEFLSHDDNNNNNDEESVPTYTKTDTDSLTHYLDAHPDVIARLSLPLTTYPSLPSFSSSSSSSPEQLERRIVITQHRIIASFFSAITSLNTDAVTLFITRGLVSPDVPSSQNGRTPLIAAVQTGSGAMVCTLLNLGASVNLPGTVGFYPPIKGKKGGAMPMVRTPLMVAAAGGKLALVKLLMEDFGADDSVIAPDGQMALRLAAEAGEREVVEYLPARRGGAWRRWKVAHGVALGRIKRAVGKICVFFEVLLWHVPKFFVWDLPKDMVVEPAVRAGKYCWEHKARFGGWCKRQVVEFPGRAKRAGKAVWGKAKKVPGAVWDVVKEIPGIAKRLVKWMWKVIKRIPAAMKAVCIGIWEGLKKVGKAVGHVFLRVVAVLHTAVAAVLDFFRNIKLKDVWDGVKEVFKAVFYGLPRAIFTGIVGLGGIIALVLAGVLGLTGKFIVFLFEALWYVVKYVPRQLGEILSGIWASIAKGYHEIMVAINPKH